MQALCKLGSLWVNKALFIPLALLESNRLGCPVETHVLSDKKRLTTEFNNLKVSSLIQVSFLLLIKVFTKYKQKT